MLNQPESLTGPLSSRGIRRHARTLLGVTTAQHVLPESQVAGRAVASGTRLSLPTPAAPPRPRASEVRDAPSIASRAWATGGDSLHQRLEREGPLEPVAPQLPQLAPLPMPHPDPDPAPLPSPQDFDRASFEPPASSFRVDDAIAAGLVVKGPKRTGRILFGMALLTAISVAATTFIAREVEEPPTREETEALAREIQGRATEAGEKARDTVNETLDVGR